MRRIEQAGGTALFYSVEVMDYYELLAARFVVRHRSKHRLRRRILRHHHLRGKTWETKSW
ncbi:MAG: hypothetical protein ABIZ35_16445 [Capsulimonas sp.]|uniref:hypothetical protein n=1 Tax=Capsulimonas sp. TaxID=2494211 RepID=UPI00326708B5